MNILGISAYYHDSAACLVQDGVTVAAAQEERFTRNKHDHRFPENAIEYCLAHAGIRHEDLDLVVAGILKMSRDEMEAGDGKETLVVWLRENRGEVLTLAGKDKRSVWTSIQGAADVCGSDGETVMKLAEGEA